MSRLNIELLKKVREKIATTPEAYDQGNEAYNDQRSPCGTVACIGGWADILSAPNKAERDRRMRGFVDLDRAADALGLSGASFWNEYAGGIQTERAILFTGDPDENWPAPFAGQYVNALDSDAFDGNRAIAAVAVAYLDHIIASGKVLE
jgi:hypothetical protein